MTQNNKDAIHFPIRINRYLLLRGYCSRRKADGYIEARKVRINGKVAVLGDQVNKADSVTVDAEVDTAKQEYVYFAFNKPRGIVSHNPMRGEKSVEDIFPAAAHSGPLYPIGRLDKDSRGLMLLSNDGRYVDKLLNPKYAHEREYLVTVDKPILGAHLQQMESGVKIERYKTKPCTATKTSKLSFDIILTEGKKHQIRRMCAALGYQVQDLKRVRIKNITLDSLKEGAARKITPTELNELLNR